MATQVQQDLQQRHSLGRANLERFPQPVTQRSGAWDHGTLLWSVGNDVDFFIELIRKFLTSYPHALAAIGGAISHDGDDLAVVEAGARTLRESLRDLAARPASEAASRLESAARAGDREAAQAAFRLLQGELGELAPAFDRIGEQLIRSEF